MRKREPWRRITHATLLLALLAGVACAGPASGQLVARGNLDLPSNSSATAAPVAVLLNDSAFLQRLGFEAAAARVCAGWREDAEITAADTRVFKDIQGRLACYDLTHVRGSLLNVGAHTGWAGIYPKSGSTAILQAASGLLVAPSGPDKLASPEANGATATQDPQGPAWPYYEATAPREHVRLISTGILTYTGPGILLLKGPDIQIDARENTTRHETHDEPMSPAPARQRELRWLHITSQNLTFTLDSPTAPIQVLASHVPEASWDGPVTLPAVTGFLRDDEDGREALGQNVHLEGAFTASMEPALAGRALQVQLDGDLRHSSLSPRPAPAQRALPWPVLAALAGALVLGTAAASWVGLHHYAEARAKRQLLQRMDSRVYNAARRFHYDEALRVLREAREIAPHDADLALSEATMLKNLGHTDDALDAYAEASRLTDPDDGMPDYWAAILCLHRQAEGDSILALGHLERALKRQPSLAATVAQDEVFRPLHGRDFTAILTEAQKRHQHKRHW